MSHRQFVGEITAIAAAGLLVLLAVLIAGPLVAAAVLLIVIPFLIIAWLLARALFRVLDATDDRCARVDQELDQERDARRQLRVVRTVSAEPQPAPVVDLFSREPVA